MSDEESGGVQGLRAWVADATERAERLFPVVGAGVSLPYAYDKSVAELTSLADLLHHDPALWSSVTVRLGGVLTMRYLAGGGAPEDQERAQGLLRDARDPGTATGATATVEDRRWAALFLLAHVMPLRQMREQAGPAPDFSALFDWTARLGPEGTTATAAEIQTFMAEVTELPLSPELLGQLQQMSRLLSAPSGIDFPDVEKLMGMMPAGFPYADQMRQMMGLMSGLSGTATGAGPTGPRQGKAPTPTPTPTPAPPPTPAPAPAPASDDVDALTLAMNAVLPTTFGFTEAIQSGDPDALNRLLGQLRAAHELLPPGQETTSAVESLIGLLLHVSQGVGGSLQDQSAARALTKTIADHFDRLSGSSIPGADGFPVMARIFTLMSQVREAHEVEDADALGALVDELGSLEEATPQGHAFRFHVLLALGQARTALGKLSLDKDMLRRGLAHLEAALAAAEHGPAPAKKQLASLSTQLDAVRAFLADDPTLIPGHVPPPPGTPTNDRWASALPLVMRYGLTRDPADLAPAIAELELICDDVRQGRAPQFAAEALWKLAEGYRARWHHTEDAADQAAATATAIEALVALAADVSLQLGSEHGLLAARSGAARGIKAALWAGSHGRAAEAVAALELGRALVLQAASTSQAVPELLEARGHHELAEAWRASGVSDAGASDGLPGELPSTLRRQALEALGYRQRDGLFTTPTMSELADGVAEGEADALVYLVPGEGEYPGMAVVVGPNIGIGVGPLPLLAETESGPLERYLDAAAARADTMHDDAAERAWEEALSALCDWAFPAALSTVLTGVTERLAADENRRENRREDRPGPPRIVLVPCGRLGIVPWHAARLPEEDPHEYACQAMVISYAASGSQFLRTVKRARRDPAAAPVLVADPRMDLTHAEGEVMALRESFYPRARMCGEFFEPSTEPEAAGTPDELLTLLANAPSLLHVASHGSAGVRPTLSALHLAFPGRTDELPAEEGGPGAKPDLGMLTVTRLLDRPVGEPPAADGPLVVLSACQTDLSTRDHDEALTLTTAFIAGGARDVVGSRWTTLDSASALLMAVFHHYVAAEGRSPVDALRAAQMWMLDPHRENPGSLTGELLREMRRPGLDRLPIWAAFIHQGHPGPGARTA
ncbi:CHAT domain-containing protein [Streptomyces sp. NPDC048483]|uniref:CHAT domain-containing protein n=1 Tax=Streptomyces sp. NPDC048483 TaxID=3154927 RepID=UPI0034451D58